MIEIKPTTRLECGARLTQSSGRGRTRVYCSDPCRTAAHRRRKDAGSWLPAVDSSWHLD
jgi:hypothetical protein